MTIHRKAQRAWTPPWWLNKELTCDSCQRIVSFDLKDVGRFVIIHNGFLTYQCTSCGANHREDKPQEVPIDVLHGHY